MGIAVGLDVGTSGVRAVALDEELRPLVRHAVTLPDGGRTRDGGHMVDEVPVLQGVREVLAVALGARDRGPAALAVCATAGTLCFRDASGRPAAAAVAYDDRRLPGCPPGGEGMPRPLRRVLAWSRSVPGTVRVLPAADAVLEALGAEPGRTDWNNALKLGWDPAALDWPPAAASLEPGLLPAADPPGAPAGGITWDGPGRGAMLVRGTTDGCAMQIGTGTLRPGDWSLSLGTTLTWKSVHAGGAPPHMPAGAYAHRLADELWLPGAAGNSGGGVAVALQPGADLGELDRRCRLPSGYAAYPLARPGERFPVDDPDFPGFGLPAREDPHLHAAILEGVAFVARLGVELINAAGVPAPEALGITGGGARSAVWPRVLATVLRRAVRCAPNAEPALGAALLAAAALRGTAVQLLDGRAAVGDAVEHEPDGELEGPLEDAYGRFRARVPQAAAR